MDPFTTPPPQKYRIPNKGMKVFHKQEVIFFIESISFEFIQVPFEMTNSTDENLTIAFMRAFCGALADSLAKAVPSRSSPNELVERIESSQIETPIKINNDQPESIKLGEKLSLIPSIYGVPLKDKKNGSKPLRGRRPRRIYPVDEPSIQPIPEDIAQTFARDATKHYKPPYTLYHLYEHDGDPLLFL